MIERCDLERIYGLYQALPELPSRHSLEQLRERVGEKPLGLVYVCQGQDAGFKLGFPLNDTEFYSWLGGVMPEFRRRGIARSLLHVQESIVRELGFEQLRVKSMNRFPAMLSMLIAEGYHIDGFTKANCVDQHKIHFVKRLL